KIELVIGKPNTRAIATAFCDRPCSSSFPTANAESTFKPTKTAIKSNGIQSLRSSNCISSSALVNAGALPHATTGFHSWKGLTEVSVVFRQLSNVATVRLGGFLDHPGSINVKTC